MNEKAELILSKWAQGSSYCSEQEKGNVVNHLAKLIDDLFKDIQQMKVEIEIIKSQNYSSSVVSDTETVFNSEGEESLTSSSLIDENIQREIIREEEL